MERVRRLYRCGYDREGVLELLRSRGDRHVSWEGQDEFVRWVLEDEVQQRYPGLRQYKARLLKHYLEDVTRGGGGGVAAEVHEDLLRHYMDCANQAVSRCMQQMLPSPPLATDSTVYKTYELANDDLIHIQQKVDFNDVGEAMWPASVTLAEFFMSRPELVRDKRVLELGCGVGFTGIVLAKLSLCRALILSDYSQGGLELLAENLKINKVEQSSVRIQQLDWTNPGEDDLYRGLDLVYAADCWYDYEMVAAFVALVKRICHLNQGKCCFVNATAIRNPRTYELYQTALLEAGFATEALELAEGSFQFPLDPAPKHTIHMEMFTLEE